MDDVFPPWYLSPGTYHHLPFFSFFCHPTNIFVFCLVWFGFGFCFVLFLATPCSMWDLSSPIRDLTHAPFSGSTGVLTTGLQGIPPTNIFGFLIIYQPCSQRAFHLGEKRAEDTFCFLFNPHNNSTRQEIQRGT